MKKSMKKAASVFMSLLLVLGMVSGSGVSSVSASGFTRYTEIQSESEADSETSMEAEAESQSIQPLAATSSAINYIPLDDNPAEEIEFDGSVVKWDGKTWTLDGYTILLDYRFTDDQLKLINGTDGSVGRAFRSLQDAKFGMELADGTEYEGGLVDGTESNRMTILAAPGVYWVDAPYDTTGRFGYPIYDNIIRPARAADDREGGTGTDQTPTTGTPYGMTLPYKYLSFVGLNSDRGNVVFASARGQSNGSNGNYTMFRFTATGAAGAVNTANVTFGNYTNADLNFPLDSVLPSGEKLSVKARTATGIVQAQLVSGGSGGLAVNSAFISRLNLLPLSAKLYVDCYIESSGHSGGGSTYINSELHFFNVNFSGGSNFYNSDIYLDPFSWNIAAALNNPGKVYEAGLADNMTGTGIMIDTRIHRGDVLKDYRGDGIGTAGMLAGYSWADKDPKSPASRSYQYNVTFDGDGTMKPYVIQEYKTPGVTIEMENFPDLLGAYRLEDSNSDVYYNLQNILGVSDFTGANAIYLDLANDYPELDVAAFKALESSVESTDFYSDIPRNASIARERVPSYNAGGNSLDSVPATGSIRSGAVVEKGPLDSESPSAARPSTTLTVSTERNKDIDLAGSWEFTAYEVSFNDDFVASYQANPSYINIQANGTTAVVTPSLTGYDKKDVLVVAKSDLGIEAAIMLVVEPEYVSAPGFKEAPTEITVPVNGTAVVDYTLDITDQNLIDNSIITWYRYKNEDASDKFLVAYSRFEPEYAYTLTEGDIGYKLMAEVTPKVNISEANTQATVTVMSDYVIMQKDITVRYWDDDWSDADVPTSGMQVEWFDSDFRDFRGNGNKSDENMSGQTEVLPGTMTLVNGWRVFDGVTTGGGGANGYTGIEPSSPGSDNNQPSRLFYVPAGIGYGDMKMEVTLAPNKNEGQGFGSAPGYMDIYLKADQMNNPDVPETAADPVNGNRMLFTPGIMNGYALRIQRLSADDITKVVGSEWNNGGAAVGVAVYLMKYENGIASYADKSSKPSDIGSSLPQTQTDLDTGKVYTDGAMIGSFKTETTVEISMVQNANDPTKGTLVAEVYSDNEVRGGDDFGYAKHVLLEAEVDWNEFGGFGTSYASSTNVNRGTNINSTLITGWRAEMEKLNLPSSVVTFESNGGTEVDPVTVAIGSTISQPSVSRSGYRLQGWYLEPTFKTEWNFASDIVVEDITLYARWIKSSGSGGSGSSGGASSRPSGSSTPSNAPSSNMPSGGSSSTAQEGGTWIQDENGWVYVNPNNTYPTDSWQLLGDEWYMFDESGHAMTGWIEAEDGTWYYADPVNADMQTGWVFDTSYGSWFFMQDSGAMQTGWVFDPAYGAWYHLQENGSMTKGWVFDTAFGGWYYLYEAGNMAVNGVTPDGYRVDATGRWVQ